MIQERTIAVKEKISSVLSVAAKQSGNSILDRALESGRDGVSAVLTQVLVDGVDQQVGLISGRIRRCRIKRIAEIYAPITDDLDVGAELKGMTALDPRDVVHEVVHRSCAATVISKVGRLVHQPEVP